MSLRKLIRQILSVAALTTSLSATAASPKDAVGVATIPTAKIKITESSMIVVPVLINGTGPYEFLLDTGASRTMVEDSLAHELGLVQVGESRIVGVQQTQSMDTFRAASVSVGGAAVEGLFLSGSKHRLTTIKDVRGVLGEDFLKNFDMLLDYRHKVVELESTTTMLEESLSGRRVPIQFTGRLQGQPTHNRLVVSGWIPEVGGGAKTLLLDSGAMYVTLFQDGLGASAQKVDVASGSFGGWKTSAVVTQVVRVVRLETESVPQVTVVAFPDHSGVDTDGLVPTSLFQAVFISHRGGFAILNPTMAKGGR